MPHIDTASGTAGGHAARAAIASQGMRRAWTTSGFARFTTRRIRRPLIDASNGPTTCRTLPVALNLFGVAPANDRSRCFTPLQEASLFALRGRCSGHGRPSMPRTTTPADRTASTQPHVVGLRMSATRRIRTGGARTGRSPPRAAHQGALRAREPKFEVACRAGLIRSSAANRMNHDRWPTTILEFSRTYCRSMRDVASESATQDTRATRELSPVCTEASTRSVDPPKIRADSCGRMSTQSAGNIGDPGFYSPMGRSLGKRSLS